MRTTPVNACILSAKMHGLVHARLCNDAEASLPWKLLRIYLQSCASIVQAVVCRPLLPPLLLSRLNPSPDAVRPRNISTSTLAHDAVAAAVSHKHHSIIRVGADLIQFVYGSHSRLATELTHHRHQSSPFCIRWLVEGKLFWIWVEVSGEESSHTQRDGPRIVANAPPAPTSCIPRLSIMKSWLQKSVFRLCHAPPAPPSCNPRSSIMRFWSQKSVSRHGESRGSNFTRLR